MVRRTMPERKERALLPATSPIAGYLTTDYLEALWDERSREVEEFRRQNPEDWKGIDLRQTRAMAVLQAYRLLSTLEQQLGVRLALPVLDRPGDL